MIHKYKIVCYTIPAWGHVNAMLSMLGKLVEVGYDVFVYSTDTFKSSIESTGAKFLEYKNFGDIDLTQGSHLPIFRRLVLEFTKNKLQSLLDVQADLIIFDNAAFWGKCVAKIKNIPSISFCSFLYVPSVFSKVFLSYCKYFNIDVIKEWMKEYKNTKGLIKDIKSKYNIKGFSLLNVLCGKGDYQVVSYSKHLQPRFSNKGYEKTMFLGPTALRPVNFETQTDLDKIYISLGTIASYEDWFKQKIISELGDCKYKVLISDRNGSFKGMELPSNFVVKEHFDQLKELGSAVVYIASCGLNSIAESIYADVPMILIPQQGEQSAVRDRLIELGIGVPFKKNKNLLEQVEKAKSINKLNEQYRKSLTETYLNEFIILVKLILKVQQREG